jgi:hypothetical protein
LGRRHHLFHVPEELGQTIDASNPFSKLPTVELFGSVVVHEVTRALL